MITVNNLLKKYGSNTALNNVSFAIPDQSICAIVGPNGAGKSTFLKILSGILDHDGGTIDCAGFHDKDKFRRDMAYMPEQRGLYMGIDIETQLRFFASIRDVSPSVSRDIITMWLKRFEIESWRHRRVSELSKGMQQKVQLLSCLVSMPSFLFMDEPFSGIDPINFRLFIDVLNEYRQQEEVTMVLSTHNMKSVEDLCTDVVLLNKGNVEVSGPINTVKEAYSRHGRYRVELNTGGVDIDRNDIYNRLSDRFEISSYQTDRNRLILEVSDKDTKSKNEGMLHLFQKLNTYDIVQCSKKIPSMEEIFIELGKQ